MDTSKKEKSKKEKIIDKILESKNILGEEVERAIV